MVVCLLLYHQQKLDFFFKKERVVCELLLKFPTCHLWYWTCKSTMNCPVMKSQKEERNSAWAMPCALGKVRDALCAVYTSG